MSEFDYLSVTISGPLVVLAKFQQLLEAFDGRLSLKLGQGADDGEIGVLRWRGPGSCAPGFAVRGPRRGRRVFDEGSDNG